jgi:hypothetical protein
MNKSDLALFSKKEQELLVETETQRLDKLNEDDLVDLLSRTRRARNKYSDLHRRQGKRTVRKAGARAATEGANERTGRKGEIFEDAVSRVARYVSREARASSNHLKEQRLAAAKSAKKKPRSRQKPSSKQRPAGTKRGKRDTDIINPARVGATSARNKRSQGKRDSRR